MSELNVKQNTRVMAQDAERLGIFASPQQLSRAAQLRHAMKLRMLQKEELARAELMDAEDGQQTVPDAKNKKSKSKKKSKKKKKTSSKKAYDVETMSTAEIEEYLKKRMKKEEENDTDSDDGGSSASEDTSEDTSSEDENIEYPRITPTPKQVKSSVSEPLSNDVDFFDWRPPQPKPI